MQKLEEKKDLQSIIEHCTLGNGKMRRKIESKVSRRKEISIRAQIIEIENKKSVEKTKDTKSWFFEKNNKIHKILITNKKEMGHK